ncbi:PREDICTED: 28 kDa heat- and acid-stable phosphoprotein-like [Cyphomyrmex costatus]|uniref:28 kDa heat-and acid-stable phosphoprotein n=1 Tax=Cyphomyrmex costatus TaxID=456900 RepID=A0A195C051_9HYME|nr:PREDICTED: 28 kDa heat- and acid-stable phosphoprotein-like [Cyphomyrmex costatus]KYM93546.1 28 kDa heat- and acid-stable phosphoprotein [Cyphomyrmex costatus]
MPRGKFVNHKGRNRHFTNPEELEEQRRQEEKKQQWRKNKGQESSSEEEDDEETKTCEANRSKSSTTDSNSESESESETEGGKAKGVENLIQVENPNRVQKKTKKLSQLHQSLDTAKPELSRREREQLEKQRAYANYQKLHAAGKTDEARADLARLAIIKQQREEAAKRREEEKKQKEMAQQKKTELTQKALGKKS